MSKVVFLFICIVTSLCEKSTTALNDANSCSIRVVYEETPKTRVKLPSDITSAKCHRNDNEKRYLFVSSSSMAFESITDYTSGVMEEDNVSNIYKFNSQQSKIKIDNPVDGEWSCHLTTQNSRGKYVRCMVHLEYRDKRTNVPASEVILNLEKTNPSDASGMAQVTTQRIIEKTPSTTPDATKMAPVTTQRIIEKTPSTTPDATKMAPVTTQRIIEKTPSTTPDATKMAPVTTQRIIEKTPSTTPDATDMAPVTTQRIIEEDPSATDATDMAPVTTQRPSNSYVTLDYSPEQLAVTTEANQVNDAHTFALNPWEWMIIGAVATGLMFICIINVIVLIYCVKQRQRKVEELKNAEINDRLANRPPMRLPSDIVYDYVYSHKIMNRNNGSNTRKP